MHQEGIKDYSIIKISKNHSHHGADHVTIEEPLEIVIRYNQKDKIHSKVISITMRTPGHDQWLATGFLYVEGIIDRYNDIQNIDFRINCQDDDYTNQTIVLTLDSKSAQKVKSLERHFYTSSSCGVCGKTSIDLLAENIKFFPKKIEGVLSYAQLLELPAILRKNQNIFSKTGSIHACGLFDFDGKLLHYFEDVGRHNALDKLIGWGLESNFLPFSEHLLLLSGRASFELIHKALIAGIPIVAAVGAPSSLAIQTAENYGLTLIGFLSEDRMNIYTHSYRIRLPA